MFCLQARRRRCPGPERIRWRGCRKGEALLINLFDEEGTAATIKRALDLEERRLRMTALHSRVLRNNVFHWGDSFLTALEEAISDRGRYIDT